MDSEMDEVVNIIIMDKNAEMELDRTCNKEEQ